MNNKYPHEITIIKHKTVKHEDVYTVSHEQNVLWYGSEGIQVDDGYIKSNSINILIPRTNVDIKKGDIVALGFIDNINTPKDLVNKDNVITVTKVFPYSVGSNLDCILVTGE